MAVKEQWRSGLGFVLAAAGSAVGLGNLWGFAYRASQGGGMVFLMLYLLIVVVVCLPLLVAEMALGRSTGRSPLVAPAVAGGRLWQPMGWLFVLVSFGILGFYVILMGWTGQTLLHALIHGLPQDKAIAQDFFDQIRGGQPAFLGQFLSLILTSLVVACGVQKGIERLSRWGLPLLFILLIGLAIWAAGLQGAHEGYRTFLLRWDANELLNPTTISNAFKQAFFSIGAGIGAILAYASYLDRRAHLPRESVLIVGMDTAVGLLAGMVTFPLVMSFGLADAVSKSTIGTLFITLPTGLSSLGMTGRLVAVLFFALAYIAAITSSVSLLEVPVASLMDRLGWTRVRAVCVSAVLTLLIGLPAVTGLPKLPGLSDAVDSLDVLGWMDSLFGGVLLILGGLFLTILLGWVAPSRLRNDLNGCNTPPALQRLLLVMLRWVSLPVVTIGVIISVIEFL